MLNRFFAGPPAGSSGAVRSGGRARMNECGQGPVAPRPERDALLRHLAWMKNDVRMGGASLPQRAEMRELPALAAGPF
jgi:hypothetical protein